MILNEIPTLLCGEEKQKLITARDIAKMLYGIEMLEYYDKNLLSGDDQSRSEEKQAEFEYLIKLLNETIDNHCVKE
jgi:hypothetical protein